MGCCLELWGWWQLLHVMKQVEEISRCENPWEMWRHVGKIRSNLERREDDVLTKQTQLSNKNGYKGRLWKKDWNGCVKPEEWYCLKLWQMTDTETGIKSSKAFRTFFFFFNLGNPHSMEKIQDNKELHMCKWLREWRRSNVERKRLYEIRWNIL